MDQPSTPQLPDVADDSAFAARTLDWVGMERIALPLRLADGQGGAIQVPAWADVAVNLGKPDVRGIHMSRLYLRVQDAFSGEAVTAAGMRRILQDLVDSQRGLSTAARVVLRYGHLLRRPALESANSGWKNYPVELEATLIDGRFSLQLTLSVEYSSTCPASAALSRQANADRFLAEFAGAAPLSPAAVGDWLASGRGLAATPHAQRSRADMRITLKPSFDELPLADLVDAVEAALGTQESARLRIGVGAPPPGASRSDWVLAAPPRAERQIILDVLNSNQWNRNETAEQLGINRTTLYKKMKRLGLDDPRLQYASPRH